MGLPGHPGPRTPFLKIKAARAPKWGLYSRSVFAPAEGPVGLAGPPRAPYTIPEHKGGSSAQVGIIFKIGVRTC